MLMGMHTCSSGGPFALIVAIVYGDGWRRIRSILSWIEFIEIEVSICNIIAGNTSNISISGVLRKCNACLKRSCYTSLQLYSDERKQFQQLLNCISFKHGKVGTWKGNQGLSKTF